MLIGNLCFDVFHQLSDAWMTTASVNEELEAKKKRKNDPKELNLG